MSLPAEHTSVSMREVRSAYMCLFAITYKWEYKGKMNVGEMVFKFEYWIEVAYDRSQSQIVAIRL
jgi:hypothetical protein